MESLYQKLIELKNSDYYPLHMPGHKRNPHCLDMADYYGIDITEIDGFDDLHEPNGLIKSIADEAASLYGAGACFLSVNGSTAANEAAILAMCCGGKEVIVERNAHKSIYFGLELSDAKPIYFFPDEMQCKTIGMANRIGNLLVENPKCKCVVITSPTYDGRVSDVSSIAEVVHKHNAVLIVDCAHGAHFGLTDCVPDNPIKKGADIVVISLHKMMPAPTQTALLLINEESIDKGSVEPKKIKHYMDVLVSSSPSYILMAGIGEAIHYMKESAPTDLEALIIRIQKLRESLSDLRVLSVDLNDEAGYVFDPCKLKIKAKDKRAIGKQIYDRLRDDFHIQCEMYTDEYALGILTVMDTEEGFMRIGKAITAIDEVLFESEMLQHSSVELTALLPQIPNAFTNIKTALEVEHELARIDADACGKISGTFVCVYPPSIPLLVPGEIITQDIIDYLEYGRRIGLNIQGIIDDRIEVLK